MTITQSTTNLALHGGAGIDACDRCLALSQLAVVLCSVPLLRGTAEHDDRIRTPQDDPQPSAPLARPLVSTHEGLAPIPSELVRAAHGVSAERARALQRLLTGWSADAVRARCLASGVAAACRCSIDYPESLHALADPPPVLYVAGNVRALDRCPAHAVGMVGTRRPTRVGREAARTIATGIAQVGGVVVSGMALGVDGASHEGALQGRGTTIAVLASGADRPSPPSHRALYQQILSAGAVVSELPPGTEPSRLTFPARNRIIAALSSAVIVVEAPKKSGALITVDHAHDLGLDVYAVPGSLASVTCEGSNKLLCDGAGGVVDGVDFMTARQGYLDPHQGARLRPVDVDQSLIHDVLVHGPQSRQELRRAASSLDPACLEAALTDLELSGWVERGLDGRYRLKRPAVA
ncbi:MAG: DNA-protecting protein DprA [Solirubrobacteraceae bacterium]|nr:DNA-protecting protein DprA [Solirubrobacteraceae bacterium]